MFKVGDRIECIRSSGGEFTAGKIYVVSEVYKRWVVVEEDDAGNLNGWTHENFRLFRSSPVKMVTRREIVPGNYGSVYVGDRNGEVVWVEVDENMTSDELREAAHIFNQLAEVLEDEE